MVAATRTLGIVGAGIMGAGIAHCAAQAGHAVILIDVDEAALERAKKAIVDGVHLQRMLGPKSPPPPAQELLSRIELGTDYQALGRATFVIESVTESWPLKREVFERLDAICAEETVFASGTSCIPITRIASCTRRPQKVLGLHFMNPAPLKPTIEMIRGFHTSDETIEAARQLIASMGKTAVLVNDGPGFVINRVLMPMVNEAACLVHERVASAEDVDRIFKGCLGHKMGPLETADMIGLDTVLESIEVLYDSFSDDKYRPSPLLRQMVQAGLLGRKSGQGFYTYRT